MSGWKIEFQKTAEFDLSSLERQIRRAIIKKLEWLVSNFDDITPLPLGGQWRGFFKLRVGDWRVIYNIMNSKKVLMIHYIDHRDKIYRKQ